MKTLKILFCLVTFCSLSLCAYAEIPHLINYQGRLTDKSGKPLEGNQSWNSGDTVLNSPGIPGTQYFIAEFRGHST